MGVQTSHPPPKKYACLLHMIQNRWVRQHGKIIIGLQALQMQPSYVILRTSCLRCSSAQCIHSLGFSARFYHVFKRFCFFLQRLYICDVDQRSPMHDRQHIQDIDMCRQNMRSAHASRGKNTALTAQLWPADCRSV